MCEEVSRTDWIDHQYLIDIVDGWHHLEAQGVFSAVDQSADYDILRGFLGQLQELLDAYARASVADTDDSDSDDWWSDKEPTLRRIHQLGRRHRPNDTRDLRELDDWLIRNDHGDDIEQIRVYETAGVVAFELFKDGVLVEKDDEEEKA